MPTIVTLTFSPCIDKSTTVPSMMPEKKLQCTAPKLEPGGGGINVARAIKKLGGETIAVFPSGGYTGKFFNHLLHAENIPAIIVDTQNETRENFIVLDIAGNSQYRFGMPGTVLLEAEWKKCIDAIENIPEAGFVVASGSLPPGVPADIYRQLAAITRRKGAKFVVDTSGDALRYAAEEGVYLLKPNLGELSTLTGISQIDTTIVENIAMDFLRGGNCEIMVVSMGEKGAVLATKKEAYRIVPPEVERKSTVGAGDSMVAGIVYSLSNGDSLKQSLAYGVACGTAATMNYGTELCNKNDVEMLLRKIELNNTIAG